jgi:hypothetical protein
MEWQLTYQGLRRMVGLKLRSISGKTDITLTSVDDDVLTVRAQSGNKNRPTEELRRIVSKMELAQPIHVDSVLFGSGSSRNQPETILANMPDVEWLNLNGRKHIVWVGKQTHEMGTLKEIEEFQATQIRARFRGRGPLTGRRPTTLVIRAREPRKASELVAAVLQASSPEPIPGLHAYRVSHDSSEVVLLADPNMAAAMEVIPILQVVDRQETIGRIRKLFPDLKVESIQLDGELIIIHLPNSGVLGLE